MKRIFLLLAAIATISSSSGAAESIWMTDFEAALERAKKEDKPILMNFTGSDFCPPCIMLKEEVFDTELFQSYAKENLILMEIDFPQNKPQSEKLRQQNAMLARALQIQGYPTLYLVNAALEVVSPRLGYYPGGAKVWTEGLEELVKAAEKP